MWSNISSFTPIKIVVMQQLPSKTVKMGLNLSIKPLYQIYGGGVEYHRLLSLCKKSASQFIMINKRF